MMGRVRALWLRWRVWAAAMAAFAVVGALQAWADGVRTLVGALGDAALLWAGVLVVMVVLVETSRQA